MLRAKHSFGKPNLTCKCPSTKADALALTTNTSQPASTHSLGGLWPAQDQNPTSKWGLTYQDPASPTTPASSARPAQPSALQHYPSPHSPSTFALVLVIAVAVILAFAQRLFPLSSTRQIAISENLYEADLKFDLESKCKRFLSANIL